MSEWFSRATSDLNGMLHDKSYNIKNIVEYLTKNEENSLNFISILWSLLDIYKIYSENTNISIVNRIHEVLKEYFNTSPKIQTEILTIFDKTDLNSIAQLQQPKLSSYVKEELTISHKYSTYSSPNENPEGFAVLLLTLFSGVNNDLVISIIYYYKLDIKMVISLIFTILETNYTEHIATRLLIFNPSSIINTYTSLSEKTFIKPSSSIISFIILNFSLSESEIQQLDKLMDTSYVSKLQELSDITSKISNLEMMPRIVLPDEIYKNEELDSLYIQYNNSLNDLLDFEQFQAIINSTDEKSIIIGIAKLSKSEPCELIQINNILYEIIKNKVSNGENFVYETLKYLSAYVCDQELALKILNNYNIPHYVYTYYILPQYAKEPNNDEFADAIWQKMQMFSADQRLIIYNNFVNLQQKQRTMIINRCKILRKLKFIFKRLSVENPSQYSEKFKKYFIKCPDKSLNMLLNHICEVSPLTEIPLNLCNNFSTVMSDFLILSLLDSIEHSKINKNVSEWPIDLSMFISQIVRNTCDTKIISDFIDICKRGLNNSQPKYACLLTYFIKETCGICYRGNMSQHDIDIKSSNNLERLLARANSKNNEEFVKISQKVTEKLNKVGIDLLICIDNMINNSLLSHDSIDNLRFLFITISDVSKINLKKTDKNFGFSLASSYHISRVVSKLSIQDIQDAISKQKLSEIFWILSPFHLYVPKSIYAKSIEEIDKLTDETNKDFMLLLRSKIFVAEEEQKNLTEKVTIFLSNNLFDWFDNDEKYIDFAYKCLLPRSIFSNFDAFFCVRFVKKLKEILNEFDVKKLLIMILSKFHFVVFSSTFEESRNLGYLIENLLEMVEFSKDLDDLLMDKLNLLLTRAENFARANTFVVYDKISKFFPCKAENRTELVKKISEIHTEKGSNIDLLKKVYIQHLSLKSNYKKEYLLEKLNPPQEMNSSSSIYRDMRYRRSDDEYRKLSRYDDPDFLPSDIKRRPKSVKLSDNNIYLPERCRYDSIQRKDHFPERNSAERVNNKTVNEERKVSYAKEDERRLSPKNTKDDEDRILQNVRKMTIHRSESQMVPNYQQIQPRQPAIPKSFLPPPFLPPPPPPLPTKPQKLPPRPQRSIHLQQQMMISHPPIPPPTIYTHPPIPPPMMFPHHPMPPIQPPPSIPPPHLIPRRPHEDDPYLPPQRQSNRYH